MVTIAECLENAEYNIWNCTAAIQNSASYIQVRNARLLLLDGYDIKADMDDVALNRLVVLVEEESHDTH